MLSRKSFPPRTIPGAVGPVQPDQGLEARLPASDQGREGLLVALPGPRDQFLQAARPVHAVAPRDAGKHAGLFLPRNIVLPRNVEDPRGWRRIHYMRDG